MSCGQLWIQAKFEMKDWLEQRCLYFFPRFSYQYCVLAAWATDSWAGKQA